MFPLDTIGHFFLGAAAVLALSRAAGALAVRVGQPRVMGEVIAGIALGPSLLGALAPEAAAWLFPKDVLPMFSGLAQIGLAVFMFFTGQELCSMRVRGTARQGLLVSQASLFVPFVGGALAALPLADRYTPRGCRSPSSSCSSDARSASRRSRCWPACWRTWTSPAPDPAG